VKHHAGGWHEPHATRRHATCGRDALSEGKSGTVVTRAADMAANQNCIVEASPLMAVSGRL